MLFVDWLKKKSALILGAFVLVALGGAGYVWGHETSSQPCDATYKYVSREVVCGKPDVIAKTGYLAFQHELEAYIEAKRVSGAVTRVSVYFRDLVHGPAWGINELADFAPASLLKLPLAFVFLSSAESQPEVLEHRLVFSGKTSVASQRIQPRVSAYAGHEYTINELLRLMIVFSDNSSYEALESFLKKEPNRLMLRDEVFQEIGLINPNDQADETITVRGYASLFRLLYNISFLNEQNSERLLAWLIEGEFDNGLRRGVPSSIPLANKFGERSLLNDTNQLHDCGIVYYPGNPYLICVMTEGKDFSKLEQAIQGISALVYEEVDSRKL